MEGISIKSGWLAFIFSAFFCLAQGTLHGQQGNISELDAKTHLEMLSDGVLLVRLQDKTKKLQILEEAGRNEELAEEKKENDAQNQRIIDGFKEYYTYCKIFFFYASSTKQILEKDYNGNLFYDSNQKALEIDTSRAIYVCDYGFAAPAGDTYRYNREGFLIRHINNGKIEQVAKTDIFFRGASYGLFGFGSLNRHVKKAIIKLNRQLYMGKKYITKPLDPEDNKEFFKAKAPPIKIEPYVFPKN